MFILAHVTCRPAEAATTFAIASLVGLIVFRRSRRLLLPLLLAAVVTGGACASKGTPSGSRPATAARVVIEAPTPNETTGSTVHVKVRLIGGTVVQRTSGKVSTTDGHLHLKVDGSVISMAYGAEQDLDNLAPGSHTLEVEFVAVDHAPFKNRVLATVFFTVKAA